MTSPAENKVGELWFDVGTLRVAPVELRVSEPAPDEIWY